MLVILVVGASAMLLRSLSNTAIRNERDKITADALAQAKEALIGYAVMSNLSTGRPGDLPCPDKHAPGSALEGTPSTPCNSNAIGHLPWKTLGLGELRDASGERLWYAVSTNFKNSNSIGTLNSDTPGTITVSNSSGNIINNGCVIYGLPNCPNPIASDAPFGTGAVAVIIAPEDVLTRQGGTQQDRSSAGNNTASNYLDIATVSGKTEDNANFSDSSSINGFIQGSVKDTDGNVIVNDQILAITKDTIMQAIQRRVAAEIKLCLVEYASLLQNSGRYPWATNPANIASYSDISDILFGHIPDQPFTNTKLDSGGIMKDIWGPNCNIQYGSWWTNWKEMVFYGLASSYKPLNPPSTPVSCGTCLIINPPSSSPDKKFVVIVAGKQLSGQSRIINADKETLSNYLESPNNLGTSPFAQGASSATFNDTVIFP